MTQEVKPIPRGAQDLRKLLREQGSVAKEEVRQWLAEQDPELTAGDINFVIGHGEAPNRLWWHEDAEGLLVSGPKPGSKPVIEETPGQVSELSDEIKKPPLLDPSEMSEPRSQFYTIALNLGITEKSARTAAFSCWLTADMFNPAEAWQAILQSPELRPSQKKSLWRNWCSWAGITVSEGLAEKVEQQYGVLSKTDRSKDPSVAPAARRRFIPVDDEVVMVEPDDPSGMSFTEALLIAKQHQKPQIVPPAPAAPAESPAMAAMINVLGGLTTAALTPRTDPNAANSTTEVVKLMVEGARSDSANALALMKQELDHRLENEARDRKAAEERSNAILLKLTDLIERQGQPRNPFDSLDQVLPGIGAKLLDKILNPPLPESGFTVSLTGPNGEPGKVSLDDYERYSKIQDKREMIQMVRQRLPELIEVGRDLALATERAVNRGREEQSPVTQLVSRNKENYDGFCVACLRVLKLPENVAEFTCPYPDCSALQSLAGEVIVPVTKSEPLIAPLEDALLEAEDQLEAREEASTEVAPSAPDEPPATPTEDQELVSGAASG